MLNKIVSITLIAFYSLTTSELHQLFKIPSLVQHYFEHQSSEKKVTFLDFLLEHYADNKLQDAQHDDLPFKSHDDCQTHNIVVFPPSEVSIYTVSRSWYLNKLYSFPTSFSSSSPLSSIWQPPKNLV